MIHAEHNTIELKNLQGAGRQKNEMAMKIKRKTKKGRQKEVRKGWRRGRRV